LPHFNNPTTDEYYFSNKHTNINADDDTNRAPQQTQQYDYQYSHRTNRYTHSNQYTN